MFGLDNYTSISAALRDYYAALFSTQLNYDREQIKESLRLSIETLTDHEQEKEQKRKEHIDCLEQQIFDLQKQLADKVLEAQNMQPADSTSQLAKADQSKQLQIALAQRDGHEKARNLLTGLVKEGSIEEIAACNREIHGFWAKEMAEKHTLNVQIAAAANVYKSLVQTQTNESFDQDAYEAAVQAEVSRLSDAAASGSDEIRPLLKQHIDRTDLEHCIDAIFEKLEQFFANNMNFWRYPYNRKATLIENLKGVDVETNKRIAQIGNDD